MRDGFIVSDAGILGGKPCVRGNRRMKGDAADILKAALALPADKRAALAASLLDSLNTDVNEDAEASWAIEVNRRVAELDGPSRQDDALGRGSPPTRRTLTTVHDREAQ